MTRKRPPPAARRARRQPRARLSATAPARIFDAALAEFAAQGFAAASTNTIARAAGVAKGLVFHHYGSKEALYLAVIEQVAQRIGDALCASGPPPAELFERLRVLSMDKLRVLQRDPLAYRVLFRAIAEAPAALRGEIARVAEALRTRIMARFLDGVDASRLRPGLTLEQALDTINLLGEGVDRRYTAYLATLPDLGASRLEAITNEVWAHFERLRDGLVRPEISREDAAPAGERAGIAPQPAAAADPAGSRRPQKC